MIKRDICIDRMRHRAINNKDEIAYFSRVNEGWDPISWHDYHEQVTRFAKSLMALGLAPNSKVSILGFNQLEWTISAIGTQYMGGVSVGIYTASSKDEVAYIVDHSDSEIFVIENMERYRKQVRDIRPSLPKVKLFVLMSNEKCQEPNVIGFNEFMSMGKSITDKTLEKRQAAIEAHQAATMIYTSGTTGNPKAVMLSHATLAWTVRNAAKSWQAGPNDKMISYLPLAHIAEQMFTVYAPIDCGLQIYFAPSFDALKDTIKEVEPTIFFGVPRVYEKIYDAINAGFLEQSEFNKKLIAYFSKIARKYHEARNASMMPSFWVNTQYQVGSKKLFLELKKKIGFSKVRISVCGAAPISKDVLNFFSGLDIPIYEIFGQSENAGPASFNLPGHTKIGSVGKAMPGSEIKIAADGEILIKGPHVFLGYYKDDNATQEVLKNGWLYTGDIGTIDKEGFLFITDRKKDLLITAGGKNISPQNLEAMLKNLPYVQSVVVVGDRRKYLCALLAPDMEMMKKKASKLGKPLEQPISLDLENSFHQEIQTELNKINNRLAPVEQIKKFALLNDEFSIDSGELTPTMKVKRKFVNQKYQLVIEQMYQ